METIATFNPKALAAVASHCADKDDPRFYLRGVLIEPAGETGCYLVATDGHALLAVHDPKACCAAPMIVQFERATIIKARAKASELVTVERDGDNWLATVTTAKGERNTGSCKYLDAKFPDWRAIMPVFKKEYQAPPIVNAAYYKRACEAAILLSSSYYLPMVFYTRGPQDSLGWSCKAGDLSVNGVIMPMKETIEFPKVLEARKAKAEAA